MTMLQGSEIGAVTSGGPFGQPPQSKYENLISLAREVPPATTVVAHPCDETSLRGAVAAAELGSSFPFWSGRSPKLPPSPSNMGSISLAMNWSTRHTVTRPQQKRSS